MCTTNRNSAHHLLSVNTVCAIHSTSAAHVCVCLVCLEYKVHTCTMLTLELMYTCMYICVSIIPHHNSVYCVCRVVPPVLHTETAARCSNTGWYRMSTSMNQEETCRPPVTKAWLFRE